MRTRYSGKHKSQKPSPTTKGEWFYMDRAEKVHYKPNLTGFLSSVTPRISKTSRFPKRDSKQNLSNGKIRSPNFSLDKILEYGKLVIEY